MHVKRLLNRIFFCSFLFPLIFFLFFLSLPLSSFISTCLDWIPALFISECCWNCCFCYCHFALFRRWLFHTHSHTTTIKSFCMIWKFEFEFQFNLCTFSLSLSHFCLSFILCLTLKASKHESVSMIYSFCMGFFLSIFKFLLSLFTEFFFL